MRSNFPALIQRPAARPVCRSGGYGAAGGLSAWHPSPPPRDARLVLLSAMMRVASLTESPAAARYLTYRKPLALSCTIPASPGKRPTGPHATRPVLPAGGLGAGDGAFLFSAMWGVSQTHFGLPATSMPRAWRRRTTAKTRQRLSRGSLFIEARAKRALHKRAFCPSASHGRPRLPLSCSTFQHGSGATSRHGLAATDSVASPARAEPHRRRSDSASALRQ